MTDASAEAGDSGALPVDGGAPPVADAADSAPPVDATPPTTPDAACTASATTQPTPCFSATVTGPLQYGFSTTYQPAAVCVPTPTPPECQCAGMYTCDCLLASPSVPQCKYGGLPTCVISYPEMGGIVDLTCN